MLNIYHKCDKNSPGKFEKNERFCMKQSNPGFEPLITFHLSALCQLAEKSRFVGNSFQSKSSFDVELLLWGEKAIQKMETLIICEGFRS